MEVPCKTKNVSTFFLYPSHCLESNEDSHWIDFTESDRIIQLIERLTTEEGSRELRKVLNEGIEQQTNMMFPTFKIAQDIQMYELLAMLGVRELASSDTAYLDDFTLDSNLKLGDAMHRISIEMTKNDITIAACNTFFTSNSCPRVLTDTVMNTTVRFSCVCLIYDRAHQNILFCGVLLKDNKESEKPCNDEDEV